MHFLPYELYEMSSSIMFVQIQSSNLISFYVVSSYFKWLYPGSHAKLFFKTTGARLHKEMQ